MSRIILHPLQRELVKQRTLELKLIAMEIKQLKLDDMWTELFTNICFYRGWVVLKEQHLEMMANIAEVNSESVKYLAQQHKKVGLQLLENLSMKTKSEDHRVKAVLRIIEKGVKNAKRDIDLILAEASAERSLFDYMKETEC